MPPAGIEPAHVLKTAVHTMQAVLPSMVERRYGRIVVGHGALVTAPGSTAYATMRWRV